MKKSTSGVLALAIAVAALVSVSEKTSAATVFVHPKFGGQILGYDIDQNGAEGVFSEYVDQPGGSVLAATETFDQRTGKIVKVLKKTVGQSDFATVGVLGSATGLVLFQHDGKNSFLTVDPLSGNAFDGAWTPPVQPGYGLSEVSSSQGSRLAVAFESSLFADNAYVFATNVARNRSGPLVSLAPILNVDEFLIAPAIAYDSATGKAVLADSQGCPEPVCTTDVALVDLKTGTISEFTDHLGVGEVDGIAVDPATGIAVTTTLVDDGVEFYDLRHRSGFEVTIPGSQGTELDCGLDVEFDPLHSVFLVEQYSSTGNPNDPQPRIYVYDERGNVLETIDLQRIAISPARIAINPNTRTGFVDEIVEPAHEFLAIQSFSY